MANRYVNWDIASPAQQSKIIEIAKKMQSAHVAGSTQNYSNAVTEIDGYLSENLTLIIRRPALCCDMGRDSKFFNEMLAFIPLSKNKAEQTTAKDKEKN
jgi:hypothetical protein